MFFFKKVESSWNVGISTYNFRKRNTTASVHTRERKLNKNKSIGKSGTLATNELAFFNSLDFLRNS